MHVWFGTPTYGGIKCLPFLDSLKATTELFEGLGWKVSWQRIEGDCYVQRARNSIARSFLASEADCLFFLDDDVSWKAEDARRVVEYPESVSFGCYPFKRKELGFPVVFDTDPVTHRPIGRTDPLALSASGAPTGFLRINREVFERIAEAHPELAYSDFEGGELIGTAHDFFPQGARNGRWWGEDFAFSNLWRGLGETLWCLPDMDLTHWAKDGTGYTGNLDQWLRSLPLDAAA